MTARGPSYVPSRGELIFVDFDPQAGHEQARRRPALVLSDQSYNRATSLCVVVPITSQVKGYPFEIEVPEECKVRGVLLVDQIKSFDWHARNATFAEASPPDLIDSVLDRLADFLEM